MDQQRQPELTDIAREQMPTTYIGEAGWLQLLEALKDRLCGYAYRELETQREVGQLRLIALPDKAVDDLAEQCRLIVMQGTSNAHEKRALLVAAIRSARGVVKPEVQADSAEA